MIRLLSPAKLNLTLEVLGKRPDGYHDIATIMQTIDLTDFVSLSEADDIRLHVTGPEAGGVPEDPEHNLAYFAAVAFQEATGIRRGVRINLVKNIPAAAGLGGGSSNAAAILRGLSILWNAGLGLAELSEMAAQLGSDVPFFLRGGTQLATGRGEQLTPAGGVEAPGREITLFVSDIEIPEKTRRLYAALRPSDFSDGSRTRALYERLTAAEPTGEEFFNVFDRAVAEVVPQIGEAMAACRDAGIHVLTAGAGPSFFSPTARRKLPRPLIADLESRFGLRALAYWFIPSAEATLTSIE